MQLSEKDQSSLPRRPSIRGIPWTVKKPGSNDTSSSSTTGGSPPVKAHHQKKGAIYHGATITGWPSLWKLDGLVRTHWAAAGTSQVQACHSSPGPLEPAKGWAAAPADSLGSMPLRGPCIALDLRPCLQSSPPTTRASR